MTRATTRYRPDLFILPAAAYVLADSSLHNLDGRMLDRRWAPIPIHTAVTPPDHDCLLARCFRLTQCRPPATNQYGKGYFLSK